MTLLNVLNTNSSFQRYFLESINFYKGLLLLLLLLLLFTPLEFFTSALADGR